MQFPCLACALLFVSITSLLVQVEGQQNATRGLIGNVALLEWQPAYEKARAFTSSLTLSQKATVVTGGNVTSPLLGFFPGLVISDGEAGINNAYFVSGWPEPATVTMTWDKTAIYQQAQAIALEFYIRGINVIDGPTSSPLGRIAWGGRQAESFAFDSYLNGIAFGLYSKGAIDAGIIPSAKHLLLYEQETNRSAALSSTEEVAYSSNVDDKALHETYLFPWYDAVKNGAGCVMCAMNAVNGSYSCENEPLIMGLLKTELGYPGMVVPDINGQKTLAGSANGGLDWASNQLWNASNVEDLVTSGQVSEDRIDDMVIRNIIGWYHVNENNGSFPTEAASGEYRPIPKDHKALIRENGGKSLVLLKNTNGALPLKSPQTLSVFGAHAGPSMAGPNTAFSISGVAETYQGHLGTSAGSGSAPMPYLVTPQHALTVRASDDHTQLRWILNDTFTGGSTGFISSGADTGVSQSISAYAQFSEVCIVFLNANGGEGADRTELRNSDQDGLVLEVAANCNNTIVVINTVGPRILDAWIENTNVTAVLYGGPLGQESGNAITDVLYGVVNPSGRLAYTIAKNESDYNARPCLTLVCNFTEGNYIDYKHFDKYDIEPRFEFGYGLSYSTFAYSDLQSSVNVTSGPATGTPSVGGRADLWDEVGTITASITNTGSVGGAEVAQLYLGFPEVADQPVRQLRGFERLELDSGETGTTEFVLRRRDLSYWDVVAQEWTVASGTYDVYVGASSRNLTLQGEIFVN
ncbi:glycoside hydrolase superfamily [Xylariales sp. PMI_506]|nr:glycoside hydrolase superfamily [Xylariales sp. PMI_506]